MGKQMEIEVEPKTNDNAAVIPSLTLLFHRSHTERLSCSESVASQPMYEGLEMALRHARIVLAADRRITGCSLWLGGEMIFSDLG